MIKPTTIIFDGWGGGGERWEFAFIRIFCHKHDKIHRKKLVERYLIVNIPALSTNSLANDLIKFQLTLTQIKMLKDL